MFKDSKIILGEAGGKEVFIDAKMANRHGLITGATGTGKTTTLKLLAESFSDAGVPVFFSDVKGDLAGMAKKYPVTFWDIFGKEGIPARTTISEMGPLLLAKLMGLNDTQSDVLTVVFKIADDEGLLLVDTKDLKAMLQHAVDNKEEYAPKYGNIAQATVTTIIRNIVALETKGAEEFFMEPALNLADWFTAGADGKGMLNILDCRQLVNDQTMYSTFLLWMLSELFELLPEVGDMDRPRMVFFFDEAHLLFTDISKALKDKIVQVIKLIRSKGVGVYFISQSPKDIPDEVLSQLGNKIQHGLRAYSPAEEKAVKVIADTFRANPDFDTFDTILHLGTGEALVSCLGPDGVPQVVEKIAVSKPETMDLSITAEEKKQFILTNNAYLKYSNAVDPDSAYEFLERMKKDVPEKEDNDTEVEDDEEEAPKKPSAKKGSSAKKKPQESAAEKNMKKVAKTAAGTIGRQAGKAIGSTVGGKFGKTLGGNVGAELARSILGTFLK